ncbi:MAG: hypothetical protein U0401_21845 [Anaerolineae bacterium]
MTNSAASCGCATELLRGYLPGLPSADTPPPLIAAGASVRLWPGR